MNYNKLSVTEFGRRMILSKDLDPVYPMLVEADMSQDQLHRWLIAYWCFYECGVSSYLSEFEHHDFWRQMLIAAENKTLSPLGERWPRAAERRHFRGKAATQCIDELAWRYRGKPEKMVEVIASAAPSIRGISIKAQSHPAFGPWISFKIADMIDRVLDIRVDFDNATVFMFKDPLLGAEMVWEQMDTKEELTPEQHNELVVKYLASVFNDRFHLKAPPFEDRPIGLQEVETVLCKWKSHMNGRYPVGKDIHEIYPSISRWMDVCETAVQLRLTLPEVGEHCQVENPIYA